jgi:hypothetical protein
MPIGSRQQARNVERLFELLGPLPAEGKAALKKALSSSPACVQPLLKELQRNLSSSIRWQDKPAVVVRVAAELLDCSRGMIYALGHRGDLELVRSPTGRTQVTVPSLLALQKRMTPWTAPNKAVAGRMAKAD